MKKILILPLFLLISFCPAMAMNKDNPDGDVYIYITKEPCEENEQTLKQKEIIPDMPLVDIKKDKPIYLKVVELWTGQDEYPLEDV